MKTIVSISMFLVLITALPAFGSIPDSQPQVMIHTVQKGQTLSVIALSYGSTVKELKDLNCLKDDGIFAKQKLLVVSRPHQIIASWYGKDFQGRPMASGVLFDKNKLAAANRYLPLGSTVRIENPRNGKSLIIPILDRGPYVKNRNIDLSEEAALQLGVHEPGVSKLVMRVVSNPD